jgi:hypothetical protein
MIKSKIDFTLPKPDVFQFMINKTEELLEEIHQCLVAPMLDYFKSYTSVPESSIPFTEGAVLRESIFYGGESAYNFKYREFSVKKYSKDNHWLKKNKGFL